MVILFLQHLFGLLPILSFGHFYFDSNNCYLLCYLYFFTFSWRCVYKKLWTACNTLFHLLYFQTKIERWSDIFGSRHASALETLLLEMPSYIADFPKCMFGLYWSNITRHYFNHKNTYIYLLVSVKIATPSLRHVNLLVQNCYYAKTLNNFDVVVRNLAIDFL